RGDIRLDAALGIGSPVLVKIEVGIEQGVTAAADVSQEDAGLAVVHLAQAAAPLASYPAGVVPLLGLEAAVAADLRTTVAALRDGAGQPVPAPLPQRLVQEFAVGEALHRQGRDAANEQERRLREGQEPSLDRVRRLMGLKAVGVRSAGILVRGLFAWGGI